MSETTEAPSAYSYPAITAITEKRLNEFLAQAKAAPEKTETLLSYFSATFQLWFDITQQDPPPQQDKDGPRFLNLIPQFPETEEPRQPAPAEKESAAVAALTAALEAVVSRLDARVSSGESTHLDTLALDQARAALHHTASE